VLSDYGEIGTREHAEGKEAREEGERDRKRLWIDSYVLPRAVCGVTFGLCYSSFTRRRAERVRNP
jgi:hypothetical protein